MRRDGDGKVNLLRFQDYFELQWEQKIYDAIGDEEVTHATFIQSCILSFGIPPEPIKLDGRTTPAIECSSRG